MGYGEDGRHSKRGIVDLEGPGGVVVVVVAIVPLRTVRDTADAEAIGE